MSKTVFSDTPPQGTIVTADFLNAVNTHRHTGEDVDGAGALDYAAAGGSNNAYTLTLSPALAAHIPGMPIRFKANHANTGAATININSLGAVALKKNYNQALAANNILSGQIVTIIYDGTNYQGIGLADTLSALLSAKGDLVYASLANTLARLAIGSTGQHLFVNAAGELPVWGNAYKLALFTRAYNADGGDVSYTGAGFQPSAILALAYIIDATYNTISIGLADGTSAIAVAMTDLAAAGNGSSTDVINLVRPSLNVGQSAVVKSLDADGVTLSWTKTGSPASVTLYGGILYIR